MLPHPHLLVRRQTSTPPHLRPARHEHAEVSGSMDMAKEYLGALAPPTGLGLLFWLLMRSILRADRNERAAARRAGEEASRARRDGDPQ